MKGTEEYDKRFRDTGNNRLTTAERQKKRKAPSLVLLSDTVIEFEAKMLLAKCKELSKIIK